MANRNRHKYTEQTPVLPVINRDSGEIGLAFPTIIGRDELEFPVLWGSGMHQTFVSEESLMSSSGAIKLLLKPTPPQARSLKSIVRIREESLSMSLVIRTTISDKMSVTRLRDYIKTMKAILHNRAVGDNV